MFLKLVELQPLSSLEKNVVADVTAIGPRPPLSFDLIDFLCIAFTITSITVGFLYTGLIGEDIIEGLNVCVETVSTGNNLA